MDAEAGGLQWLIIDVIAVVVLAGAMIYGIMMWRRKNQTPAQKARTDEIVKKNYRDPDQQ
ncbi:flagellar basal body-associated protein FliL [Rhodoligotrophos appendicifer]|uniref:hypothetical protein n=1 Tax=Rhodoligotrophos appendicifer TaxID=987056 RepID=UPI0011848C86|nr:hypothetical protein [Rhodoligotrophos appendicifer]